MNSWLGSRDMEKATSGQRGFRTFVSEGELSLVGPSRIWLMLEEHERSIDDAWFLVTMDDAQPFASFPSTRHDQAYDLNFCDGHVELYRLRDPASRNLGVPNAKMSANNADWTQLKNVTTVR